MGASFLATDFLSCSRTQHNYSDLRASYGHGLDLRSTPAECPKFESLIIACAFAQLRIVAAPL